MRYTEQHHETLRVIGAIHAKGSPVYGEEIIEACLDKESLRRLVMSLDRLTAELADGNWFLREYRNQEEAFADREFRITENGLIATDERKWPYARNMDRLYVNLYKDDTREKSPADHSVKFFCRAHLYNWAHSDTIINRGSAPDLGYCLSRVADPTDEQLAEWIYLGMDVPEPKSDDTWQKVIISQVPTAAGPFAISETPIK